MIGRIGRPVVLALIITISLWAGAAAADLFDAPVASVRSPASAPLVTTRHASHRPRIGHKPTPRPSRAP